MADVNKLKPLILKWEGGFANDPADAGGATMKGVTITTYKLYRASKGVLSTTIDDLKAISDEDWTNVLKTMYWDKWQADKINNQSIANILVDWVWASGVYGIKIPQVILGVKQDGIVGAITLSAVNNYPDRKELFDKIVDERKLFIDRICASRPANQKFKKGWLNRLNDFKYV